MKGNLSNNIKKHAFLTLTILLFN